MADDIIQNQPPVGLQFEFDPDRRIVRITFRENTFAINPPSIEVPFAYQKESVAQILEFEAQLKISELPMGTKPHRYPPGIRGKLRCAEIIMLEAKSELAGEAAVGEGRVGEDEAAAEAERIKAKIGLVT